MFTKNLNQELAVWARAGMRDTGDHKPQLRRNPSKGMLEDTTGSKGGLRRKKFGKQLTLFQL